MSTEVAPEAVGSSNASANGRRPVPTGSTSPSHPTVQLALATILILSGLSLAVINGTTPTYQSSVLAESGNFFALAETGSTLFAASGDGGSILLERSTDHGVDWTQNPVPYSAVAGGSPWVLAAIAASGSDLLLAAATRAVGGTPYPAGVGPAYPTSPCGSNSTVLTAFSSDGGITWNTSSLSLPDASATSLQAEINGQIAAVAWTGETVDCYNTTGEVQAVTSLDGGADWSAVQSMTPVGAFIPIGEQIEMAPDQGGLVVAFGSVANGQSSAQLRLWEFSAEYPDGFVPIAVLPAPSGWTLQGAGSTPAYLLTPTYLIPLSRPPYTALPFDQLQTDGGGIGLLPTVVSLVPVGQGTLEIAATTPDNLGVDC
ncbi:MAG: hypothetical protein L3K08_06080, partial [Thermoplasmata archaeon]|nr:hypothetical protein [Thermoplasmata archaeon]